MNFFSLVRFHILHVKYTMHLYTAQERKSTPCKKNWFFCSFQGMQNALHGKGGHDVNPRDLIGFLLVRILPYGLFPWKWL